MENYKKCIIAFLDILGFKNMINTKAFDEICEIFSMVMPENDFGIALYKAANSTDENLVRYNEVLNETKLRIMSDSIIIAAPSGKPEALAVVIDICNVIQEQLYELEKPVLLRGAIAEGNFYLDEQLIFGRGLVDAYIAQENYAIYPRIIISDAVAEGKCVSVENQPNLPKDKDGYFYINTLERYFGSKTPDELHASERYTRIKQCVDENLSGYADNRVREKYIWMRNEIKRIEEKLWRDKGVILM